MHMHNAYNFLFIDKIQIIFKVLGCDLPNLIPSLIFKLDQNANTLLTGILKIKAAGMVMKYNTGLQIVNAYYIIAYY